MKVKLVILNKYEHQHTYKLHILSFCLPLVQLKIAQLCSIKTVGVRWGKLTRTGAGMGLDTRLMSQSSYS